MRPVVLAPILGVTALYMIGWWRLWRRAPHAVARWRPAAALVGLASMAVALSCGLDRLAHELFVAHMLQHMLLITVAAPALLLADPFPVAMWALPRAIRHRVGRVVRHGTIVARLWRTLTPMTLTWLGYALVLWLWHLPGPYDAALGDRLVHDLEHAAFFGAAVLFWWPVVNPAPRLRTSAPHGARVVYLVLAAIQTAGLGLLLTLTPGVLYATYEAAPRVADLTPLEDQMWGGVLMWGVGSAIDMVAVLVLLHRVLSTGEPRMTAPSRPPVP